jgi:Protein of unknown function (DUF1579)
MLKHQVIVLALGLLIGGLALKAQGPTAARPTAENEKLAAFVGIWKDEAEMMPGPFSPGGKMNMTETCEWFTGRFSLVCHTDTTGFIGDIRTLTVINYDAVEKVYSYYELNSLGHDDIAKGTVNGDTWTFNGEFKIGGKLVKTRSTIKLTTPDSALMKSEASVDGGPWNSVMELKGTRVKQSVSGINPTTGDHRTGL